MNLFNLKTMFSIALIGIKHAIWSLQWQYYRMLHVKCALLQYLGEIFKKRDLVPNARNAL